MGTKGSNDDTKPQAKQVKHEARLSQASRLAFLLILLISQPDGIVTRDNMEFDLYYEHENNTGGQKNNPENAIGLALYLFFSREKK